MKNSLLVLLLSVFCLSVNTVRSQSNVTLKINHKLAGESFAFNTAATTTSESIFDVSRLEYYMSGFTIMHDGTSTVLPDLHFLVRADEATELDLGEVNATDITEIRFHIGVDPSVNHEDPSAYASDNPLAPQNPSMHWGWAAGYRFIAMEGMGGTNLDQGYQLHGLGDDNYFETTQSVIPTVNTGGILLELDADYTRVLNDIGVETGVISHGEFGPAKRALENMRDFVFSQAGTTAVTDFTALSKLQMYPNPTATGQVQVVTETPAASPVLLQVFGTDGKLLTAKMSEGNVTTLNIEAKGLYFLQVSQDGKTVGYEKITVQ